MEALRHYINSLPIAERDVFAARCGTTVGYLRKAISKGSRMGEGLCINIERESHGAVVCEDLRPDIDWAFIRGTVRPESVRARDCPGCVA